ncbi:Uncharacterised protein [Acinetobacter baumannii]|nr:Uncharacterised protein [Acinetobacter baumannii]
MILLKNILLSRMQYIKMFGLIIAICIQNGLVKVIMNKYGLLMDIMIPNGSQVVTQLYKMFIKIRMV